MTREITDGLTLMPPPFASGLDVWSRGDGTPGSASCAGWDGAAIVDDPDFGPCLEFRGAPGLARLRFTGETPVLPGCYLKIRARVKVVSGGAPSVRVGAWAGSATSAHVPGLSEAGRAVPLSEPGRVAEVSAILGTGARNGVDMAWGCEAAYGHVGLDILCTTASVVRIEALGIEDVTLSVLPVAPDQLDVRDFGAMGDGIADDAPAFAAADRAARGRLLMVPEGTYRLSADVSLNAPARFCGQARMAPEHRLVLRRTFHLDAYEEAFGDRVLGLRRALQALLRDPDCETLDLCGRRIVLPGPLDLAEAAGTRRHRRRKVIRNGTIAADGGALWEPVLVDATARLLQGTILQMDEPDRAAEIPVGACVAGFGVDPEIYVASRVRVPGALELSRRPHAGPAARPLLFRRARYLVDASGFVALSGLRFEDVVFDGSGEASGVMLGPGVQDVAFRGCEFEGLRVAGVTAPGASSARHELSACRFGGAGTALVWSVLGRDATVRDCRFDGMALSLDGSGHRVAGNRWSGEPPHGEAPRLVFTAPNARAVVTGNLLRGVSAVQFDSLVMDANLTE